MKKNNYNLIFKIIPSSKNAFIINILTSQFYINCSSVNKRIKFDIYIIHETDSLVILRLIIVCMTSYIFTYIPYPPKRSFTSFKIYIAKMVLSCFASYTITIPASLFSYFVYFYARNEIQYFFYANFLIKKNKDLINKNVASEVHDSILAYFMVLLTVLLIFFVSKHALRDRQSFLKHII